MCVELLTPDGNWSSYPPHRHDDSPECPVNNEEAYYFRIAIGRRHRVRPDMASGCTAPTPTTDLVDDNLTVGDGDVYVIPRGLPRTVRGRARGTRCTT